MTTATNNIATGNSAINNFAPLARLLWKEYRAIRGFWIALVVLVVLIQFITISFSQDARDSMEIIYNFALGAPAFFAIGCAGAAFAMEHEEGTFEFLRAGPATSRQVFISKLAIALLATLAMLSLLLPVAIWFMRGQLPETPTFHGMLGLWLVAALEAIAWGMLFSLLAVRPLPAICLALFATSTVAHTLAWAQASGPIADFSYSNYLQAVPWRLAIVGVVFAIDVYLGRTWLSGINVGSQARTAATVEKGKSTSTRTVPHSENARTLMAKPDRSALFGHLFWQQWRQSWKLMVAMASLCFVAVLISRMLLPVFVDDRFTNIPILVLAAIVGCCVFLADQERRHYRFFVEHNVPPRKVWLTRLLPWSLCALIVVWWFSWQRFAEEFGPYITHEIELSTNRWLHQADDHQWRQLIYLPPIPLVFGGVAVAFAAGQWASMFIRSGVMAAFAGLLISGLLCGWVFLMDTMHVGFLWSVWPIPLTLLFATWLRAPDWVRENTRWSARLRAAALLVIPAIVLLIAVPVHRVHQIPLVEPGFDSDEYLTEITPAALETGNLYRKAGDLYVEAKWRLITSRYWARPSRPEMENFLIDKDTDWLKSNEQALALVLKASERPSCCLHDLRKSQEPVELRNSEGLISLVIASAWQLEREDKLDDALERYFAAINILGQWASHNSPGDGRAYFSGRIFSDLRDWAAHRDQSPDKIRSAIGRLQQLSVDPLRFTGGVKSIYIFVQKTLAGDRRSIVANYGWRGFQVNWDSTNLLWAKLMPWENDRALRMLNLLTNVALDRLQQLKDLMEQEDGKGVISVLPPGHRSALDFFKVPYVGWHRRSEVDRAEWLETTNPDLSAVGSWGIQAALDLAEFETRRRATILVLALQGYRLDHGKLPGSLSELVGNYLDKLPRDPYSGREFVYVPEGVAKPNDEMEADDLRVGKITAEQPGVWSMGDELSISTWTQPDRTDELTGKVTPGAEVQYYQYRIPGLQGRRLPRSEFWSRGMWFPVPDQRK